MDSVKNYRTAYYNRLEQEKEGHHENEAGAPAIEMQPRVEPTTNNTKEAAISMQTEGLNMLQEGVLKNDMGKITAANVLLQKSKDAFSEVEVIPHKKPKKN